MNQRDEITKNLQNLSHPSKHQTYAKFGILPAESRPLYLQQQDQPLYRSESPFTSRVHHPPFFSQQPPGASRMHHQARLFDESDIPQLRESEVTPMPRSANPKSAQRFADPKVSLMRGGQSFMFTNLSKKRGLADLDKEYSSPFAPRKQNVYGTPNLLAARPREQDVDEESTSKPRLNATAQRLAMQSRTDVFTKLAQPSIYGVDSKLPGNTPKVGKSGQISHEEMRVALQSVTDKLDELQNISQKIEFHDLPLKIAEQQNHGRRDIVGTTLSAPYAYLPLQAIEMPQEIKESYKTLTDKYPISEIREISERNRTVYIAINKKLWVWDYSAQAQPSVPSKLFEVNDRPRVGRVPTESAKLGSIIFEHKITALREISTVNMSSPISKFLVDDSILLLVATTVDIRLVVVSKGDLSGLKVTQSTVDPFTFSSDPNCRVQSIAEFKKVGRVFLGLSDGSVLNVIFDSSTHWLTKGTKKSIKTKDETSGIFFQCVKKVMPSWLNTTKEVRQLRVDEQRNLLYVLNTQTNGRDQGQSIIQIYDLGNFGDEMKSIVTINQYQLIQKLMGFQGKDISQHEISQISEQFHFVAVLPLTLSESTQIQMVVVTSQGDRIFVSFEQEARGGDHSDEHRNIERVEKAGLQNDYLIDQRPSQNNWVVAAFTSLPNNCIQQDSKLLQGVLMSPFKEHPIIQSRRTNFIKAGVTQVAYDYYSSVLVCQTEDKLVILGPNEKPTDLEDDELLLTYQEVYLAAEQQSALPLPASVLPGRQVARPEVMATLGLLKLREKPLWGKGGHMRMEYCPRSVLETQVFMQTRMIVVKDNWLVELARIRPIDLVFMLLQELAHNPGQRQFLMNDFDDLASKYTHKELCVMLLQLLIDKEANYLVSNRVKEMLKIRQMVLHQPLDNVGRSFFGAQHTAPRFRGQQVNQLELSIERRNMNRSQSPISRQAFAPQMMHRNTMSDEEAWNHLCRFELKQTGELTQSSTTKEVRDLAWEMLLAYGEQFNPRPDGLHETARHSALFTYLSRLLSPVWEMNAVTRPSLGSMKDLKSNFDLVIPLRQRLEALRDFIKNNFSYLHGTSGLISNEVAIGQRSLFDHEKVQVRQLEVFLERCLDVIEFLSVIGEGNLLPKVAQALSKELQEQLVSAKFSTMVLTGSNELAQSTLTTVVRLSSTETGEHAAAQLEHRLKEVEQICATFFLAGDNHVFLGESLLAKAKDNKNLDQQDQLIDRALHHIQSNPEKVNLELVIPTLVEKGIILGVVDICLMKAAKLDLQKEQPTISSIYSIIEALFWALYRSIEGSLTDSVKLDEEMVENKKYYNMFRFYMNRIHDHTQKQDLLKKIVNNISLQFHKQPILIHLFRSFLHRGVSVDALTESLNRVELVATLREFFELQSREKQLSVGQFSQIERLLQKTRAFAELAQMTLRVVSDKVVLKVDRTLKNTGELQDYKLSCEERRQKVKRDIAFLTNHVQDDKLFGKVESVIHCTQTDLKRLKTDLQDCLDTLNEQIAALESAKTKIAALEKLDLSKLQNFKDSRNRHRNLGTEREALKKFISESNYRLIGAKDLKSLLAELHLQDRFLSLILKMKPTTEDTIKQWQSQISRYSKQWLGDLKLCNGSQEAFVESLGRDFRAIGLSAKTSEHQIIKAEISQFIRRAYVFTPEDLKAGKRHTNSRFLMTEIGCLGSDLIMEIAKDFDNAQELQSATQLIVEVFAVLKEWLEAVDSDDKQKQDFLNKGKSVVLDGVLINSIGSFLKEKALELSPEHAKTLQNAHESAISLLRQKYSQHWLNAPEPMTQLQVPQVSHQPSPQINRAEQSQVGNNQLDLTKQPLTSKPDLSNHGREPTRGAKQVRPGRSLSPSDDPLRPQQQQQHPPTSSSKKLSLVEMYRSQNEQI